ncbi:MAG: hypothetical protein WAU01_13605 [Saprospiraceae bacterium]
MADKKLRIFAGPNGSGKTTIIKEIQKLYNICSFVNADYLQEVLNRLHYFDYSLIYSEVIENEEWIEFLQKQNRPASSHLRKILFSNFDLISSESINGYDAAIISDFFRSKLLESDHSFSFETVFSHESKIDFMREARTKGYKIYLYFICTQDPKVNIQRVKNRVLQGGHDVSKLKIESRYYRSLDLLYNAFLLSDREFIIDTTIDKGDVILEKNGPLVSLKVEQVSTWVDKYLLKYLD